MFTLTWTRREKILITILIIIIITFAFLYGSLTRDSSRTSSIEAIQSYQPVVKKKKDLLVTKEPTSIFVDLKGQLEKPGVYQLHAGARLYEAVEKAQGLTAQADIQQVNLAEKLLDGTAIYIPKKGEKVATTSSVSGKNTNSDGNKVNINTATIEELQELNGLGPTRAQAIVKYREEQGPFQKIEQITEVPGIGEKTLAKFRAQIIC